MACCSGGHYASPRGKQRQAHIGRRDLAHPCSSSGGGLRATAWSNMIPERVDNSVRLGETTKWRVKPLRTRRPIVRQVSWVGSYGPCTAAAKSRTPDSPKPNTPGPTPPPVYLTRHFQFLSVHQSAQRGPTTKRTSGGGPSPNASSGSSGS